MRTIKGSEVTEIVKMLFLRAAKMPGKDALAAIKTAYETEPTPIAKRSPASARTECSGIRRNRYAVLSGHRYGCGFCRNRSAGDNRGKS